MSADYDKGAFHYAREIWEEAETLAGGDRFNHMLIRGLQELTASLEEQLEDLRLLLERLSDRETRK